MKRTINSLKSIAILSLVLLVSIACDNDFTNIQSDIEGIKNFNSSSKLFPFVTKTKTFTPFTANGTNDVVGVETGVLNGSMFGIYNSPTEAFGTTIASVTTQVTPLAFNPDFGEEDRTVESVWLNIPYFSTTESTDTDGTVNYTLDSLFGTSAKKFKLSIYRNNYVLNDLDPNTGFETSQSFYSNQGNVFNANTTDADLLYEDSEFTISASENTILDEEGQVVERFAPGLRVNLLNSNPTNGENDNSTFWENIFFANQETDVLSSENNFKDFFRGLIIKVEPLTVDEMPNASAFTYLNFTNGRIVFDYTNAEETEDSNTTYTLGFNGNRVNTFEKADVEDYNGDEDNLYLNGTDGSMAELELFSGDIENDEGVMMPALDYFNSKKDKWLINEANLVFYVNQDIVEGDEPDRVTLYNLKNNTPIFDYFLDQSENTTQPILSKNGYSEILERDSNNKGVKYKIRLTGYITNLLERDSTNVKLGLFLANNINNTNQSKIEGINSDSDDSTLNIVPSTSILSPKGTVLHGFNSNEELSAKFEIFYTEPEN